MPTRLDSLFRADLVLKLRLEVELSIAVGAVNPVAKPLMTNILELRLISFYQELLDSVWFEWVADRATGVFDLCPDRRVKPIHVFPWNVWSTLPFCTGAAL